MPCARTSRSPGEHHGHQPQPVEVGERSGVHHASVAQDGDVSQISYSSSMRWLT